MRILLTLMVSSFLVGCATDQLPGWPLQVNSQYYIDIDPNTKQVTCLKFKIISTLPYKLDRNFEMVDIMECQGLGGFNPDDMKAVINWVSDAQAWAKDRRCKLK